MRGQPRADLPTDSSPAAQPPQNDAATSHADALLEDLKRREAAQQEFDRKHPLPAINPVLPAPSAPAQTPPPAPATVASALANDPVAASPAPAAVETHDREWWNSHSQSLEQALAAAVAQLAEAERQDLKNGYSGAQAIYRQRVEAVADAHAAIDKLHDDARRAGVPPGWLR